MRGTTPKHHHHQEWGTYLTIISILGALTLFTGILLRDCARILPIGR